MNVEAPVIQIAKFIIQDPEFFSVHRAFTSTLSKFYFVSNKKQN
jgi:hypothetical protein